MRKQLYLTIFIILVLSLFVVGPSSSAFASRLNATAPALGDAASYSVLAGSIVTNTGPTTVQGDLGVSPSIGQPPHVSGFPPGTVGPPGEIHDADSHAAAAQAANTAAYGQLSGQLCDVDYGGVTELNGLSLEPGVYCATAFLLSGTLTLTGSGVWIFKSASTLTLMQGASVIGGDPCNVWWGVGSAATLGVQSSLYGNILALESIHLQTGATLNGRALAQTGAVTLDSNTILGPVCMELPTSTPTSTATATATAEVPIATPTSTATATATATATEYVPTPTGTYIPPTATTEVPSATPASTATATATVTATEYVPTPTGTHIPPTATAEVPTATNMPVMTALPPTGGAPLQSESAPWGLVIIAGFSTLALVFGSRAYRKTSKRSQ